MAVITPLLVVSFQDSELPALQELAGLLGYPDAQFVVGGVAEVVAALNARAHQPDYLVIDIGDMGREVFAMLDEIAVHCEPKVRVAVIGSVNDISFYRELRARGIVEYSARPVNFGDLRTALFQAQTQSHGHGHANRPQGSVISCMSAASGDGASTVAVNLAYCLAEQFNEPTVLIDMDYQFGLIAKSLDLTAPFGIRELFDYPERGLDELLVEKMLVPYGRNMKIIASPHELRQLPMIQPEVIRELINVLRGKFRYIVIDIPHVWTHWTSAAISYSDHVVMVAQLWLRSLTHASRLMSAWQAIGVNEKDVSLVINRSGAKFKEAITLQDFERICRLKIEAHINNNVKAVVNAETNGKTLYESGQDLVLQQQIVQFAQSIISHSHSNVTVGEHASFNAANKKGLLTFLGKKNG
jgi:pilus assembly protein CpaE